MKCIVVTPERTVVDVKEADFVVVPLYDGELGIAPKHTPLIGRLGSGELRITAKKTESSENSETLSYYVEGGFVEVLDDTVSLLTNRSFPSQELVMDEVLAAMESAKARPSNTPKLAELKESAVRVVRSQKILAEKNAGKRS